DGEATRAIERADCVLAVGYDIAEHDPASWNPDRETTVVHLDHEPAEVYAHYNPELEIVADIPMGLRRLTGTVDAIDEPSWCEETHDTILSNATEMPDDDEPFTVEGTLPYLRETMADDDVLLSDVGSHKMAIAQRFPVYEPNTCIVSNGLASMGIAVPGAVAADLAVEESVVAATGDGGFLMNAAELNTAARLGCGFTVLLFNDDEYRLITEEFEEVVGDTFGTDLTNPDYVTFAESFGMESYRPESWADLDAALEECVGNDELSLVEVRLG
ncbi:thiamine pyrophosphate-dependent enzyme, partial [Halobium palmae]